MYIYRIFEQRIKKNISWPHFLRNELIKQRFPGRNSVFGITHCSIKSQFTIVFIPFLVLIRFLSGLIKKIYENDAASDERPLLCFLIKAAESIHHVCRVITQFLPQIRKSVPTLLIRWQFQPSEPVISSLLVTQLSVPTLLTSYTSERVLTYPHSVTCKSLMMY